MKNPLSLQHLLLYGPPGSGKTTSADWLVRQIWKNQKAVMSMTMNAADERSLEAIRQKIIPFMRTSWIPSEEKKPRFIILDECETLTEAAQLSLQTFLDHDPKDVCVILICNSQSRIHPKLRQRLLRIRYDPPQVYNPDTAFVEITRNDFRSLQTRMGIEKRLWLYLNTHESKIGELIESDTTDIHTILTEIMLIANYCNLINDDIITQINITYSIINLHELAKIQIIQLIKTIRKKFDKAILP